ncbi:hypothetical protein AYI68_g7890 [Smittium mucronatum]|uniref:Uncharacterized protein n=1 Tax=Smittium mucronatum TaxID=133383 RepID=A0A1R0GMH4_9FUNG|nr:hypothetical protein AYI68_g7890 [Smittium mucronatum]
MVGTNPSIRLFTIRQSLSVLAALSVFTAPTAGIIGKSLIWRGGGGGQKFNESIGKGDKRSSITGSSSKLKY